ncbi:MAG: hypothetical protein KJN76_01265 [Eudoraea sp.]|nr:hypothetical protein [Eudoraea sp.]
MKNIVFIILLFFSGMLLEWGYAQELTEQESGNYGYPLFGDSSPLAIKLKFSTKKIKAETNDSTYVASVFYYQLADSGWDSLPIDIRARGHFRKNNCYYVPLKLKFGKSVIKGTIFEQHRKLKLVSPCLRELDNNDYLLKEYLAYKLFEVISPYHLRTRLAAFEFVEEKGDRTKNHKLKAILIEDMDQLAERFNGREMKRRVHPLQQDDLASLRNDLFQYLIGNTDFSNRSLHNEELLYTENKYVPIPYDFDMSGLVNASYATISGMQNMKGSIASVTERVYKGYNRGNELLEQVRQEFIAHKAEMLAVVDGLKVEFNNPNRFNEAREFVNEFFEVVEDDKKFQRRVIEKTREY